MKRDSQHRGPAVLRFFICLLIVIILVLVGVFFLNRDNRSEGDRPYVVTGTGEPITPPPATPEPTVEPTPTPAEPTAQPTPEITPEPTAEPTPTPTVIPQSALSVILTKFSLPAPAGDGDAGISSSYVSALNEYSVMELTGWGYANLDYFDGENCGTYVIVTQLSTNKSLAFLAVNADGISGKDHTGAVCKNASKCDWRAYIDVADYEPGTYGLGLVLVYKNGTKDEYRYYKFGDLQSFTVNDGEIITPVTVTAEDAQ